MATAHLILGLLVDQPRHGYDLKKLHDQRRPHGKPLAFGQVYATLRRLERDGLVRRVEQQRRSGPDRAPYVMTEAGRSHIDAWLNAVEPPATSYSDALPTKLACLRMVAPSQYTTYLAAQQTAHQARLQELTALRRRPHLTLTDTIAADYAIAHMEADLSWLRHQLNRTSSQL
ncbi:PadR family transcriptional regulator [Micromonospora sp. 067-2]|uniref:PadR family transcriptional regulator n=1 Tax=Micromonospora sp. 067-2 TaxID=2789270 RepID=UPI00397A627B